MVHSTDDAIKLTTRPDGDGWLIDFAYWEGKGGLILEALHPSTRVVTTAHFCRHGVGRCSGGCRSSHSLSLGLAWPR
ncbi:hypothetical protein LJR267_010644 [Paraburkholderia hospita]|uniref:hypothetical protein n=1 Tax=Paraburkholderia hospita TaxID=169430 RepID=UPI003ECC53DA